MKKWVGFLILLFLINGCAQQVQEQETTTSTTTTILSSLPAGEYEFLVGEIKNIEGVIIELVEIKEDKNIVLRVSGKEIIISGKTKQSIISDNLELRATDVTFGITPSEHIAIIKVSPFVLETFEYLLKVDELINIGGHDIKLYDLHRDQITIRVDGKDHPLYEREEKKISDLSITNTKQYFNDIKSMRWVVLKIIPAN